MFCRATMLNMRLISLTGIILLRLLRALLIPRALPFTMQTAKAMLLRLNPSNRRWSVPIHRTAFLLMLRARLEKTYG